ncbi:uncharacterized protein FIBRA_01629 [Fibroporia radiculosa]|uniref:Major facilitator superfamily (MFS) profile domain-containing protein n=1 Tax=Fibroporia radiculosa TaxID=599839 RepID=J4I8L3_9APHY|nr:uncharacterized protein FIBRA_01629 [Fibroporia radiculosa]CCL99611.1 predicted protein [Fibroporia radiculosa]
MSMGEDKVDAQESKLDEVEDIILSSKGISLEEKKLVRKLDVRIMPVACILYLFAYLDRSNLGNARLQGLPQDILGGDPTGTLYGWTSSIFFISYILFQIPATVLSKLFPPRIWTGCFVIGWGICSTLAAAAFNYAGLMVSRFGLGFFEAGFGPGIPLYMSLFYTKEEMGMRMAYWFGFAAVAGAFGGLIAFGVQHVHSTVENWRLLFIIEGAPTVVLGIVCMFMLPNRPEETSYLNEDERCLAIERMNRGLSGDVGRVVNTSKTYLGRFFGLEGVLYFGSNCALASISAFLPTIIATFGYTNALAQLLTVPPYAVAAIFLCMNSYVSDRLQSRGLFVAAVSAVAGLGYILLLAVPDNVHVRFFAVFCITSGTYTTIGIVIAWFAHNLGSETKKATGIPMYMAIGQCGSVLGSKIYPTTEAPQYIKGFAITCALLFVSALVALILSISYRLENQRRDRLYGKPEPNATVDTSELADNAPDFRYVP